jgi:proline iminopeptidase
VDDLESIRRHFGLRRMSLVGHSWGVAPAVFYARTRPAQVDRLVLYDPMPARASHMARFGQNLGSWMDSTTADRVRSLSAARADVSADPVATCRDFWAVFIRGYMADPHAPITMRGDVCAAPPDAIRNGSLIYAAALAPFDWDWRGAFTGIQVPALIIHGAQSPIPAESADEWLSVLPRAHLVRIEGAGHFAHVEQREAFVRAIREFAR